MLAVLSFRHFGDGYAVLLPSVWIVIGFIFQGVSATAVGVGKSYLEGMNMTTPRLNTDRHLPQLIPHRLLHDGDGRPRQ